MNDRRRFLRVLSASVLAAGCGSHGQSEPGSAKGGGTAGTAGAGGTPAAGGAGGEAPAENVCGMTGKFIVAVGTASDFPEMGLHKVPNTTVLIGRDENGLYARSALCTHMRCNMNQPKVVLEGGEFTTGGDIMPDGGVVCYCHNSRYAPDGTVEMGPAVVPLDALAISACDDGTLEVDLKSLVDPNFRAPG